MKITGLTAAGGASYVFHLNVGGFTIKRCRWNPNSGQILFPRRYDRNGRPHRVVFVHGTRVNRLRELLESGETALPRDRRSALTARILSASGER